MRQIVLDTETTGLSPTEGHRIIEIGCVELINRRLTGRHYHTYLKPDRKVDLCALRVHGITDAFLKDKPSFSDVLSEFLDYLKDDELIIHNAPFDLGFLNAELKRADYKAITSLEAHCSVIDTLSIARKLHPGQKNNLDALCKRYQVQNEHRTLHGALLDAEILADVYLVMTGGQEVFTFNSAPDQQGRLSESGKELPLQHYKTPVMKPTDEELCAHDNYFK